MTAEITIDSKTIRQVRVKGEPYQKTVEFIAKGDRNIGGYWRYTDGNTNYITGPKFDKFNGLFYENRLGHWEKVSPGCSGLVKYHLSSKMKPVDEDEEKGRDEDLKATYWLVASNVKRSSL